MSETPVAGIGILSDAERDTVVRAWNATALDLPQSACVHEMFERQAAALPTNIAVASKGISLTYAELNARANRLARYLRQQGVGPDKTVAICVERGTEMILALLAILKAGGAYVPLDPTYPRDRLTYMLKDSAPVACLFHTATEPMVRALGSSVPSLKLDDPGAPWAGLSGDDIPRAETGVKPTNVVYIIYTSGSTGLPKGVAIRGNNLLNYAQFILRKLSVRPERNSPASRRSPPIWATPRCSPPCWAGASCMSSTARPPRTRSCTKSTCAPIGSTSSRSRPPHFKALFDATRMSVVIPRKALVFGGERLASTFVDEILRDESVLSRLQPLWAHRVHGRLDHPPHREGPGKDPQRPLQPSPANTQITSSTARASRCPSARSARSHISGAGVSVGYINRDEETIRRFKPVPFSAKAGQRMYMTGDLGRWLPNGMIEFLGRNDFRSSCGDSASSWARLSRLWPDARRQRGGGDCAR